jgi:signal transduction histidine kinase
MVKEMDACQEKIIQLSAQAASQKQDIAKLEALKTRIRELIAERQRLEHNLAQATSRISTLESQLAHAPAPQVVSHSAILSLDALAANAWQDFGPRCERKGVNLEIANPDGHQLIKTNAARLQMLLQHLLENALMASQPQGALHLRLKLSYETGMLQIQVTDSGEGLSPEDQRSLFTDMDEPPAGIGSLTEIRGAVRMVQLLKGKIWLRSKPETFTTFRVQLPVRILD